jgi:hypothetical protein
VEKIQAPSASTDSDDYESSAKGGGGEHRSRADSADVGKSGMVPDTGEDDSEEDSAGGSGESPDQGEEDEEDSGAVATRKNRPVYSKETNEKGQQFFVEFMKVNGFDDEQIKLYQRKYKVQSFNIYRRGYRIFVEEMEKLGIGTDQLISYAATVEVVRKVLIEVAKSDTSRSGTNAMITALSVAVNRVFGKPLSKDKSVMDLVKALEKEYPKATKVRPREDLNLEPVLEKIASWGEDSALSLEDLQGKVFVLLLALRSVRFREMETIRRSSWVFDPARGMGSFLLIKKGENTESRMEVFDTKKGNLNLPGALDELCRRVQPSKGEPDSPFVTSEGKVLTNAQIREAAMRVLSAAGEPSTQPYQLKRAGLSVLWNAGPRIQDISAHARHSFKTTTTLDHYISFDGGRKNTETIAKVLGKEPK